MRESALLVIRDEQFAAIGARAVRRRGDAVFARLCAEHPAFAREIFDYLFDFAIQLGYQDEEQVYRYCRLAVFLGGADPAHPLYRQVCPEVSSPLMEAEARLAFTENEMMPRLAGEAWRPPSPPPDSPTGGVDGARVEYDVYRSTLAVRFPESER